MAASLLYLGIGLGAHSGGKNDESEGSEINRAEVSSNVNAPITRTDGRNETEIYTQYRIVQSLSADLDKGIRVVVAGDSTRMRNLNGTGYGVAAYQSLKRVADIIHIPFNMGGTVSWRRHLDTWLAVVGGFEIAHINAGLHDLAFGIAKDAAWHQSLEQYRGSLIWIIETLRRHGVEHIVWGLCTPVVEEWHNNNPNRAIGRRNSDIIAYNEAASEVMRDLGVQVNDLYTPLFNAGVEKCILPDGVHLSTYGSRIAGDLVSDILRPLITKCSRS